MKKNILIFGHSYVTPFCDINNQYTKLFNKNDYEVTVVYLTGAPDESVRAKHCADHVIFLNSSKKSARGLKLAALKTMLALHREKNFQIVICHRYKPTYIMLWVARFMRIPVLFSIMHELGTLKNLSRKLMVRLLAQDNFVLAGVSNAVRDDLYRSNWGIPADRVITLHNSLDVDFLEPHILSKEQARQQLNLSPDDFVFGNIGRLAINKDQRTLIQAFAEIKDQCPRAKLIILGQGALEDELKNLAKSLNVQNDVIFAGFVPNAAYFAKAFDVFVSSSTQEAFGMVLLEAMLAKVPVIATRVNGIPEVVGQSGTLVAPKNSSQLATALLTAYQKNIEALEKWGENGYDRVIDYFSLTQFKRLFWMLPFFKKELA